MSKPALHTIRLPAHHPAISDMGDDDEIHVTARKAPTPIRDPMPHDLKPSERPMPLEHDFHVTSISRVAKAKGGGAQGGKHGKPTKSDPMAYMKNKAAEEAAEVT